MPAAGAPILAEDFTPTEADTQNTIGTTSSTAYTATLSGGVTCGVAFVAPTSGKVEIGMSVAFDNTGSGVSFVSFVLREGGTVGAGSTVLAADDSRSMWNVAGMRASMLEPVFGLTPGDTYNVQMVYRVTANTGQYLNKTLWVKPLP